MPRTFDNPHPHAVLLDAARQLRKAAASCTQAAASYGWQTPANDALARQRLQLARANITAALARLDSYPDTEPAPEPAPPLDHCGACGEVWPCTVAAAPGRYRPDEAARHHVAGTRGVR
jgi:hypothetical protein